MPNALTITPKDMRTQPPRSIAEAFERRLLKAEAHFEDSKALVLSFVPEMLPLLHGRACLRQIENGLAEMHEFRRALQDLDL